MQKVTKRKKPSNLLENPLRENLDLLDQIRADAVNDIESLTENFQHMTLVAESVQQNYQALLAQNHLLKSTLLSIIDECECRQGNQCDRCQRILQILAGDNPEQKLDPVLKYKAILTQIRKLG
ncbi:MAG: hypothetical protein QQW96_20150 [Tychonema bourrellyi B0820]|uniref:Uncharacterized protein n=1 Tax=Tychonema bourrellyi FEM_GT703 TaxID=2040638 RepID=A0A2G4F2Y2_9CYAN|nr:hypothetical protein [Tychonema bourrellyi]MDQ2099950.1 hypothetical protein [Tychonema bourrellyi B0820]PHX56109.1 hypothetical protein CP500_007325 [Tychonema bourrellyi FEM_GT703]